MQRRRPIRKRPMLRPMRRPGMRPPGRYPNRQVQVPPALLAANHFFQEEQYQQAAEAFLRLAQTAETRQLRQAPILYLQSARSFLFLGELSSAVHWLNRSMRMLAEEQRWGELYRTGNRSITLLEETGHTEQATALDLWIHKTIPEEVFVRLNSRKHDSESLESERVILPTHCNQCGGVVNPEEVEWLDDNTQAVCAYCGSLIREAN